MTGPPPAVLRAFGGAALRLPLGFVLVFYGCEWLATRRAGRWQLYAAWELALPYWPAAYPLYFGVLLWPGLVLGLARRASQVQRWERAMAHAIGLAGLVFLLLPAQLGHPPPEAGAWRAWAALAVWLAGQHNLVPSLHVALSLVTLRAVWPLAAAAWRPGLALWWALTALSVLLTHQHHLLDVATGVLLAMAVTRGWGEGEGGAGGDRLAADGRVMEG